jgi:putative Mg2+ transporter-C (MgtC) family protein
VLSWSDIILRLGVAAIAGGALGLNRDLRGKPVGVRTLALVALATAMITALADPLGKGGFTDAGSRVIQGVLTGIGFLGAGVIFHHAQHVRVRGLTSAACVWLTACVGIMCGAGHWPIVIVSLAIAFLVLVFGGGVERGLRRAIGGRADPASGNRDADQSSEAGPHQPGK